jgi:cytochrome c
MRIDNRVLVAAIGIAIASLAGRAQTPKSGKEVFEARCSGCHALDRDKEGPRLGGVYGRAAGSVAGFQYSAELSKAKLVWNDETLEKWLADPDQLVPNNDMAFHVPNSDERRSIIQFLKSGAAK